MARSSTASQLERICRGYRRALGGLLGSRPVDEIEPCWVRGRETEPAAAARPAGGYPASAFGGIPIEAPLVHFGWRGYR
jgi:hypothetical protein